VKIACLQLNSGNDIQANIDVIADLVKQAAHQGAQLVALPENAFLMEAPGSPRTLYTEHEHPGVKAAAALAKQYGVWLLVGSTAVSEDESGKTLNRALMFDDRGHITCRYDKIHLFDAELPSGETYAESARFQPGSRAVLTQTPWAVIGLTICYDVRFPHLYRALAQAGAAILTVPAAFTATTGAAHWHVLLRARAIENGCYVVAPAQTGSHPGGRQTYGHSLIIDPWGAVLADAGEAVGVICAELDLARVAETRARLPSLRHGRDFTLSEC
jgi:predicted amidohydrolase